MEIPISNIKKASRNRNPPPPPRKKKNIPIFSEMELFSSNSKNL